MGKPKKQVDNEDEQPKSYLSYGVEDNPPIGVTIFYAIQIAMANLCFIIMLAVILTKLICADQAFTSRMFSTMSFMAGVTTILLTCCGVRIPIFQGPSLVFFLPYLTAATDPRWRCNALAENSTVTNDSNMTGATGDDYAPPWQTEWAKIAGSLMAAQAIQMLLALTGTIALLMRLIRPITITVIFILLGVWLHDFVATFMKVHWGVSAFTSIGFMFRFQLGLEAMAFMWPVLLYSNCFRRTEEYFLAFYHWDCWLGYRASHSCVLICWAMSAIITAAGGFPNDPDDIRYNARTDINAESIRNAPVFQFPYPGQFCSIDFRLEYFIIHLVAVVMTVLESMGDYCQYAVTCCMPRPPDHAFNRGIFMEGLCGFFAALLGMGHATTSYSNAIGIIRITKVASRRVYVVSGLVLIVLGMFGKVGAVFVSIPMSVLAGPVFIGTALLVGSAFINLKHTNLATIRNQTTLGCSIMVGVILPFYFGAHEADIDTGIAMSGSTIADRIIIAVLKIPYLVGGIAAVLLDNTLPGRFSKLEREDDQQVGETEKDSPADKLLIQQNEQDELHQKIEVQQQHKRQLLTVYDPPYISKYTKMWKWTRYMPILPNPHPDEHELGENEKSETTRDRETNV